MWFSARQVSVVSDLSGLVWKREWHVLD